MKKFFGLVAFTALLAVSCGEPDEPVLVESAAPLLVSTNPADGAGELTATSLSVVFTFDQNIKCTREAQAGVTIDGGAAVDQVNAYGTDLTVKVSGLERGKSYTITLPAGTVQGYKENQKASQAVTLRFNMKEPDPDPYADPTLPDNAAVRRMRELGLGWNLGNQLDAYVNWQSDRYLQPDEEVWGNPKATQATFNKVKSYGFTSVRIPVTWLGAIGAAPEYKIDEKWMARVTEVVGYAHNAGLQVIVNTHHDENHGDDHWLNLKAAPGNAALNAQIKEEITAVWTQIANNFKDCGDWLMFEGFNELNDGGWGWSEDFRRDPTRQCNVLNEWQQTFVDAVRATGGNNATRWLGISTYCANPSFEQYLKMPTDPAGKLMLSVHFYDPSDYTIGEKQYSDWGHTGDPKRKANGGDEDYVREIFGNLYFKYVAKNVPVYVGEFGCSLRSKSDTRAWNFFLYYLRFIVKAAKTYGLSCIVWDNGGEDAPGQEHHGYINHGTGAFMSNGQEPVEAMMTAWKTETDSYTLQSVYDSAPRP